MKLTFAIPAAFAALSFLPSLAFAGEPNDPPQAPSAGDVVPPAPATSAKPRVLVFGDGVVRFHVERDPQAGRMTFRLADPAVRVASAPVVVMTTEHGPREFPLTALEGQSGVWVWSGDLVRAERFDGQMRIVVDGRTYTSPLASVWTSQVVTYQPRHGGRVLQLADCGASVEVVQDPATGMITVYSFEDVVVTGPPVLTVTETTGPTTISLLPVEGKPGVWRAKHETLKSRTTSIRIRLVVNGQPCDAPLVFASRPGGRIVSVNGGPTFEVVRDPQAGHYTFYAVEESWNGKTYVVENPTVVVDGRTYPLTRVEGEPRAWRLVGLDAAGSDARNGQLNFTLFGKTLSARLGLSGIGLDVR